MPDGPFAQLSPTAPAVVHLCRPGRDPHFFRVSDHLYRPAGCNVTSSQRACLKRKLAVRTCAHRDGRGLLSLTHLGTASPPHSVPTDADSTLANFNNTDGPLMNIEKNSSTFFERCTIRDITNPEVNGSAITAGNVDRSSRISSTVLIRDCTLTNNTSPFFSYTSTSGGRFYSDTPLLIFEDVTSKKDTVPAEDADAVRPGVGAAFLQEQDRPEIPVATEPPAPPPLVRALAIADDARRLAPLSCYPYTPMTATHPLRRTIPSPPCTLSSRLPTQLQLHCTNKQHGSAMPRGPPAHTLRTVGGAVSTGAVSATS